VRRGPTNHEPVGRPRQGRENESHGLWAVGFREIETNMGERLEAGERERV
jgi:hypothetical protein